jgi:hypothetical protein
MGSLGSKSGFCKEKGENNKGEKIHLSLTLTKIKEDEVNLHP